MLVALAAVVLLVGGGLLVLRSGWFIAGRIEHALTRQFGGPVRVARASYEGEGRFVVEGVRLRAPGIDGEAGVIAEIERAMIRMDEAALSRLEAMPLEVLVSSMRLRVAEDAEDPGRFAFAALRPDWAADAEGAAPDIRIDSLTVEVGAFRGASFAPRTRRAFSARMQRTAGFDGEAGWHEVQLEELEPPPGVQESSRITLAGRLNARTLENEFGLPVLEIRPDTIALIPTAARVVLEQMNLAGTVRDVSAGWSPRGFHFAFEPERLSFVVPVEAGIEWTRYAEGRIEAVGTRPRLRVDGGRVRFAADRLEMTGLTGRVESTAAADAEAGAEIAGVPYEIAFAISGLDPAALGEGGTAAWARDVLATAPFELSFITRDLRVGLDPASGEVPATRAIDLPRQVASVLEVFAFERFALGTEFDLRRGPPVAGPTGPEASPVVVVGRGRITEAVGRYSGFPYRLENVSADLDFDDREVRIAEVAGRGAGGAPVSIRGTVRELGAYPEVALRLDADAVPVDADLLAALEHAIGGGLEQLRHEPSWRALQDAGVLPAAAAAGGSVDLRLAIDRTPGPGRNTTVSGVVDLHAVDVLPADFPYAMRLEGPVAVHRGGVEIADADTGLEVRTAGGGQGRVRGRISWDETHVVAPHLEITVAEDRVGPALAAAIPPQADESAAAAWPGGAVASTGAMLLQLGVQGRLDWTALLTPDGAGGIAHEVVAELSGGRLDVSPLLPEAAVGDLDPRQGDWTLHEMRADLSAAAGRSVELDLRGRTSEGAAVRITRGPVAGDPERLTVSATDLEVQGRLEDLVAALPEDLGGSSVRRGIARHAPRGRIDLQIAWTPAGDDGERRALEAIVVPRRLELDLDGTPMRFTGRGGEIRMLVGGPEPPRVRCIALDLAVEDPADPDGNLSEGGERTRGVVLDGTFEPGQAMPRIELDALWTMARIRSPLLRQVLRWVGAETQLEQIQRLEAAGDLDLRVQVAGPAAGQSADGVDWRIDLRPRTLSVKVRGVPVSIRIAEGSRIEIEPGGILVHDLAADNENLAAWIDGRVSTADGLELDLAMEVNGQLLGRQIAAMLPEAVRETLERLELQETRPTRLGDARIRYRRGDTDDPPAIDFEAVIELDDASMRAGVLLASITGPFEVRYGSGPGRAPSLSIEASPSRLRMAGQDLRDLEAVLTLDPDGRTVRLERLWGRAGEGRLTASGWFETDPAGAYEVRVDLAGLPLSDIRFDREDAVAADPPTDGPVHRISGDVHGTFRLGGRRGDPASAVGRGQLVVQDADLFAIPPMLGLLQAVQLTIPASSFDHASASLFLLGRRLHVDELYLESSFAGETAHSLTARGTVDLDTQRIDGRVRSRSGLLMPVREFLGAVGDAVAAIELEGTIREPRVRVVPLAGDRGEAMSVQARPVRPAGAEADPDIPDEGTDA